MYAGHESRKKFENSRINQRFYYFFYKYLV